MLDTDEIQQKIREFASEREWECFHTPKNLSMALSIETSELMEHFQWLSSEESQNIMNTPKAEQVRHEIADVAVYLLRLADVLSINLSDAIHEKMKLNAEKYPVERSKGHARKYNEI